MAGPYQRLANGQSADTGAQALPTVMNAVQEGLEDAESAIAGKAATGHLHSGVYDPAGSAASAQAAAVQRANHTGTQTASTISDFHTAVRTNRLDQMATPTAAVAMGSQKITGLGTPTASTDAATKAYADSVASAGVGVVDVLANGIVADTRFFTVSTTAGNATVTATASVHASLGANVFSASDVGKAIHLYGASGSGWLRTTVASYVSPTQVTVASTPSATTTGRGAFVGTDNTSALSSVCSALTDTQTLYFPASEFFYLSSGGHTVGAAHNVVAGAGRHATRIVTTSDTANVFTFNRTATTWRPQFAEVRDLSILHGTALANDLDPGSVTWPTGGSALRFTSTYYSGSRVRNVHICGFYIGIDVDSGQFQVDDSIIQSCAFAGCRFNNSADPDYGMHSVRGCHFAWSDGAVETGARAVQWIQGGGLGVTDCRFDGRQQYHVELDFNGALATGNVRISDNMFEDFGTHAVYIDVSAGTGDLGYIAIADNVVQGGSDIPFKLVAATHGANRSRPASDHGIAAVSISGNMRYNGSGVFIDLTRCRDVAVIGNRQLKGGTVLTQTNCVNVTEV